MVTNEIDSSKCVLWQYNHARWLLRLLQMKDDLAADVVTKVWDWFFEKVFSLFSADTILEGDTSYGFGLWIWGTLIGIKRPMNETGAYISDELYRRVLKARFYLFTTNGSLAELNKYCSIMFNAGAGTDNEEKVVTITDNGDMTIDYAFSWDLNEDEEALVDLVDDDKSPLLFPHPSGVECTISGITYEEFFGFSGYYHDIGTQGVVNTVPILVIQEDMLGYRKEVTEGEGVYEWRVPPRPYYTKIGSGASETFKKLKYVKSENKYYWYNKDKTGGPGYEEVAQSEYEGESPTSNIYFGNTLATAKPLFIVHAKNTVYRKGREWVVVEQPATTGFCLKDGTALSYDEGGYYYTPTGGIKTYVLGQSIGNLDNAVFHEGKEDPAPPDPEPEA